MIQFFYKIRGSISIFLVLIMLPMFTYAGLIVDGVRISAARTALTGAGDLTMNAAMSEYNNVLFDVYGLFAVSENMDELEKNVALYFNNCIDNEGILQESDSYSRQFINSIFDSYSTDDISFDNIIDLELEDDIVLEGIDASALANPVVMERQIVEYMKYRGPVSIGKGLLTKLGCIGEVSKQNKVIESKLEYDEALDTVQDYCVNAYKKINEYIETLGSSKYDGDHIKKLEADIESARKSISKATEYIVAVQSSYYELEPLMPDGSWDEDTKAYQDDMLKTLNELKEKSHESASTYWELAVNGFGTLYEDKNGNVSFELQNVNLNIPDINTASKSALGDDLLVIDALKGSTADIRKVVWLLSIADTYYYPQSEIQFKALQAYKNGRYQIATVYNYAANMNTAWRMTADEELQNAVNKLSEWNKDADKLISLLTEAETKLNDIITNSKTLDKIRQEWNGNINKLENSDIKDNMFNEYNNSARQFNEENIISLKNIIVENRTYIEALKGKVQAVMFFGQSVCEMENPSASGLISGSVSEAIKEGTEDHDIGSEASRIMNEKFLEPVVTDLAQMYEKGLQPISLEDPKCIFWKYLYNTCSKIVEEQKTGKDSDQETTNAKNNRKALKNKGNSSKDADTTGVTTGKYLEGDDTIAQISAAINDLANGNSNTNSFSPTNLSNSDDDKVVAQEAKKNLEASNKLLDGLKGIKKVLETGRDYVYIEEYMTEMFSCYTSGLKDGTQMSLNNNDMSKNVFYRSELEYILYGQPSVNTNLNLAKASIFGVRFALNSIYAFTAQETRSAALAAAIAIAGWTGFGVPIVETVILLAWSMAESMVDLELLCKGESVALFKSSTTWYLGINGAAKLVKNTAVKVANAVVDDVFTKIENFTTETIDDCSESIGKYIDDTNQGIIDGITGYMSTSLETMATKLLGTTDYSVNEDQIRSSVDGWIKGLRTKANSDGGVKGKAMMAVADMMDSDIGLVNGMSVKEYIVSKINKAYAEVVQKQHINLSNTIEEMISAVTKPVADKVKEAVNESSEALKSKTSEIMNSGRETAKEELNKAIEDYMGEINGGESGVGDVSTASAFGMTYKEYLKMFVLLTITVDPGGANRTAMLKRTAELIQLNVNSTDGEFDISKAYTMFELDASVYIRTTFMDVPVTNGVGPDGENTYELDFSNLGTGRRRVTYVGVLGY